MIDRTSRLSAPVLEYDELVSWMGEQKAFGASIGFTCGAFDILHAGHANYLQRAREQCDRLIVGVNSDDSVRTYKNPLRPIITEQDRINLVAALACVDVVVLMRETRPAILLQLLKPDLYIKGGDYSAEKLQSASLVESNGGRVMVIPVEHAISTSAIISRISEIASYNSVSRTAQRCEQPKIVFLDRDGTLIENVPFIRDPAKVHLLPGVPGGLKALQENGYILVVITNQQGIGLGYFGYEEFVAINSEMLRQMSPYGIQISRFYYCPHSQSDQCACRKPGTEMIERALQYFGARAEDSFLIGDSLSDIEAAQKSRCVGILVGKTDTHAKAIPSTSNFNGAVQLILKQQAHDI